MTEERKYRGFASLDRALVSEIARKGGIAGQATGRAHQFTSDEARAAGRKGGLSRAAKLRAEREAAKANEGNGQSQ